MTQIHKMKRKQQKAVNMYVNIKDPINDSYFFSYLLLKNRRLRKAVSTAL